MSFFGECPQHTKTIAKYRGQTAAAVEWSACFGPTVLSTGHGFPYLILL